MNIPKLKLISDLSSSTYRITWRWHDAASDETVSPRSSTRQRATEWYVKWLDKYYFGPERRIVKQDRRRRSENRQFELRSSGRRLIDQDPEFEDRVKWMLDEIKTLSKARG